MTGSNTCIGNLHHEQPAAASDNLSIDVFLLPYMCVLDLARIAIFFLFQDRQPKVARHFSFRLRKEGFYRLIT
jgi:hypothetical protein